MGCTDVWAVEIVDVVEEVDKLDAVDVDTARLQGFLVWVCVEAEEAVDKPVAILRLVVVVAAAAQQIVAVVVAVVCSSDKLKVYRPLCSPLVTGLDHQETRHYY